MTSDGNIEENCLPCRREESRGVHGYGYNLRGGYKFLSTGFDGNLVTTDEPVDEKAFHIGIEKEGEYVDGEGYYDDDQNE